MAQLSQTQVLTAADRFKNNFQTQKQQLTKNPYDISQLLSQNLNYSPNVQNFNQIYGNLMPLNGLLPYLHQPPTFTPEKRQRTVFSIAQLDELEKIFAQQKYVVGIERTELAMRLRLTESQVKVWFQNRRIKARKNLALKDGSLGKSGPASEKLTAYEQAKRQLAEEFAKSLTEGALEREGRTTPKGRGISNIPQSTCHSTPIPASSTMPVPAGNQKSTSLSSSPASSFEETQISKSKILENSGSSESEGVVVDVSANSANSGHRNQLQLHAQSTVQGLQGPLQNQKFPNFQTAKNYQNLNFQNNLVDAVNVNNFYNFTNQTPANTNSNNFLQNYTGANYFNVNYNLQMGNLGNCQIKLEKEDEEVDVC